jgi:hypothetical protein
VHGNGSAIRHLKNQSDDEKLRKRKEMLIRKGNNSARASKSGSL